MIEPVELPYAYNALEPALGRKQVKLHYERHYLRYLQRTNELTGGRFSTSTQAVHEALANKDGRLFNQAAQTWNHELYFASMRPGARGLTPLQLEQLGEDFPRRWVAAAQGVFGSGWVWLVESGGRYYIDATHDAGLCCVPGGHQNILMVMDVWEHAYYCDYPGERAEYAQAWIDHLADWSRLRR